MRSHEFHHRRTNGFLPPRYHVYRLSADSEDGWHAIPPVPLWTDPEGEALPQRELSVQLAWDDDRLYLRASCREPALILDAGLTPDDPHFWQQDHIDLHLRQHGRDGAATGDDADLVQCILAPDGRVFDSRGLWKRGLIATAGSHRTGFWQAQMSIRFSDLGQPVPAAGTTIPASIAHVRWGEGRIDSANLSATELGFSQQARFAALVFESDPPPAVQLRAITIATDRNGELPTQADAATVLVNLSQAPIRGRLFLRRESGTGAGVAHVQEVTLAPGETAISWRLTLARPQFTRYALGWEGTGTVVSELAAVSLRAGVPWVDLSQLPRRRPALFFTAEAVAEVRAKAAQPFFQRIKQRMRLPAVEALQPFAADAFAAATADLQRRELCTVLNGDLNGWVLTGDAAYQRHATQYIQGAASRIHDLDSGSNSLDDSKLTVILPIIYDAFLPHLAPAEQTVWRQFAERFLLRYWRTAVHRHWDAVCIPNANPCCNAGGAMLALVLPEHPCAAEALHLARKFIVHHLDYCLGSDGINTEGVQYAHFALRTSILFGRALELALGTDDGLFAHPGIARAGDNFRLLLSNTGRCLGINDTFPAPVGPEIGWFLGARYDDPFCLWYGDHGIRWSERCEAARPRVLGYPCRDLDALALLYRPDLPEQTTPPPLPQLCVSHEVEIGTVRSGATYDCRWVAALKGARPPYTHHNQADVGSFIVDLRGEDILLDTGYYQPLATDHSLPLIEGARVRAAQGNEHAGTIIHACDDDGIQYLACDFTPSFRGAAQRAVRHLLLVGDEGLVVLDDIIPADPAASITAQYQCGGLPEADGTGRMLLIRRPQVVARMDLLTYPDLRLTVHPERSYTHHWAWYDTDCHWHPVTGSYRRDSDLPLVTTFLDASERDPGQPRCSWSGRELHLTLPSGRGIVFVRTSQGWIWERTACR